MARWKIKNVGMKGVSMAVPENVVKTSDFDFFSQEEAEVFDNTVGIRSYLKNWDGRGIVLMFCCLNP